MKKEKKTTILIEFQEGKFSDAKQIEKNELGFIAVLIYDKNVKQLSTKLRWTQYYASMNA